MHFYPAPVAWHPEAQREEGVTYSIGFSVKSQMWGVNNQPIQTSLMKMALSSLMMKSCPNRLLSLQVYCLPSWTIHHLSKVTHCIISQILQCVTLSLQPLTVAVRWWNAIGRMQPLTFVLVRDSWKKLSQCFMQRSLHNCVVPLNTCKWCRISGTWSYKLCKWLRKLYLFIISLDDKARNKAILRWHSSFILTLASQVSKSHQKILSGQKKVKLHW